MNSQSGQSIIQALISLALMSIMAIAFTSMMTTQQRESVALAERIAAQDFNRSVISFLQNQNQCSTLFAASNLVNPQALPFAPDAKSVTLILKSLPALNLNAGDAVSPIAGTLKLAGSNDSVPGIQLVITPPSTATLVLTYNQAGLVRQIHNPTFPNISLLTSLVGTNLTLLGCGQATTLTCAGLGPPAAPQGWPLGSCVTNALGYGTGGSVSFVAKTPGSFVCTAGGWYCLALGIPTGSP